MRRPIVIIADDLSGAAELAGIAYSHGFTAEVQRQFDPASTAEVIAVDTDSRGLLPEVAADRVRTAARAILAAKPAWIFKKVDSLLRGNVRAEIEALLMETGQRRALLIPANPSRGRRIAGGSYFIQGTPLDQTELANDPEQPRRTALIAELLGPGKLPLYLAPWGAQPPRRGIVVPDRVGDIEGLRGWTRQCDDLTLPAGAADFFLAFLSQRGGSHARDFQPVEVPAIARPVLFVCGSRASWNRHAGRCAESGVPIRPFPPGFAGEQGPAEDLPAWADQVALAMTSEGRLLLGIGPSESTAQPADLVARLADPAALVLERVSVATLLVEGGATAAAVVQRLGWRRLEVVAAAPAGIGIVQPLGVPSAPLVWIKPGSYPWPEAVWRSVQ